MPRALPVLLVLLLTLLAYLPVFHAGFIWDDDSYLTANPNLNDLSGLKRIWLEPSASPQYYPLVFTSFWFERRLWGEGPLGYHLANLLLHGVSSILAYLLLRRLRVPGAWFAAALFAVHPAQSESVVWITERKNLLSTLFVFATASVFFRTADRPRRGLENRDRVWILLLFLSALLSKTVAATLPVSLALVLWWKRGRLAKPEWITLGLMMIPAGLLGIQTAWIERVHVGAVGESWNLSILERLLVAGRAVWFYAGRVVWPDRISFIYPRWALSTGDPIQWVYPIAVLVAVGTLAALHRRIGRGPLVAVLIFLGTLFPALGFFNIYPFRFSFVADHFAYLAHLGLFILIGAAGARVAERFDRRLVAGIGAAWIVTLALLTFSRCGAYTDEETLWRDTLAKNPTAWMAHTNLGVLLDRQGRLEEAIEHHQASVRLRPDVAGNHNNLAVVLEKAQRTDEALAAYGAALRLEPENGEIGRNLANLLAMLSRYPQAELCYREVLRLEPTDTASMNNLAHVLLCQGRAGEAEEVLRKLIAIDPGRPKAWANLADALQRLGRREEATAALVRARSLGAFEGEMQEP